MQTAKSEESEAPRRTWLIGLVVVLIGYIACVGPVFALANRGIVSNEIACGIYFPLMWTDNVPVLNELIFDYVDWCEQMISKPVP